MVIFAIIGIYLLYESLNECVCNKKKTFFSQFAFPVFILLMYVIILMLGTPVHYLPR